MTKKYKAGDLRLYHFPQVPCDPFHVDVASPKEALKIAAILWDYDSFQFNNNIKPDYSNATGLEIMDRDGEWVEWYNDNGNCLTDLNLCQDCNELYGGWGWIGKSHECKKESDYV